MTKYDVIIVGAGPAGLKCAQMLSNSALDILVLEKDEVPGNKVCAGGITRPGISLLQLPDNVIEHKVVTVGFHSRHFHNLKNLSEPVMFTVNRKELGKWQLSLLKDTRVQFRNNARVTDIKNDSVIINKDEEIGFRYLVGADGVNSIVRRHLKLPIEKVLASVQYQIPVNNPESKIEMFLDAKYFHSWYAWVFPHRDTLAVGACADARYLTGKKLKDNFHRWLKKEGFDISNAKYESFPIGYDYRGYRFGNIFLAGEAAGLASGLTGEGIYQSVLSGQQIAMTILDKAGEKDYMQEATKYNHYQHKILNLSIRMGGLRSLLHDMIVLALKNKQLNRKITNNFSKKTDKPGE